MKKEIKIPSMGESITEATVGIILKPTGSHVEADDEILELETDKVNQVIYAPQAGIVTLTVSSDETVKIDQVIGYIDTEGKEPAPPKAKEAEPVKEQKEEAPKKVQPPVQKTSEQSARLGRDEYLSEITSKPPKTIEKSPEIPQTKSIERAPLGTREEARRKMSKIRKVIATRLVEVQQNTAMLTTFNEVDMSRVMELRTTYQEQFQKEHGVKLGFMSFFVKAVVSALAEFPDLNSYIEGDEIVQRKYYDVGIAVATDRGLIVPVVKDCDHLSFAEIERKIAEFGKKGRDGTISVDDLRGGGFTITNGGTYGSLLSTPILNPPQSGILGMHKIQKRPVAIDDQIVIRPMMYLALSYDHRIVDGKEAVTFLVHIKNFLEDPARLLLEV